MRQGSKSLPRSTKEGLVHSATSARKIGTQSMRIAALAITPLDDYHAQARVSWQALYRKKDGGEERIDFQVIYRVQRIGENPKIFA